jgi:hypothetical protein
MAGGKCLLLLTLSLNTSRGESKNATFPPPPPAPPPDPPYTEHRRAHLAGELLGFPGQPVVAEAVASTAHTLSITLLNETFSPSLTTADVAACLAHANDDPHSEAGWDASVRASALVWNRIDDRSLSIVVPQMRGFEIERDTHVRVVLGHKMLSSGLNNSHDLIATPPFTIKALLPCASLSQDCASCLSYNGAGLNHTHTCAWCPSDRRCLPQTDLGISGSQCPGLTVDSCGGEHAGGGW